MAEFKVFVSNWHFEIWVNQVEKTEWILICNNCWQCSTMCVVASMVHNYMAWSNSWTAFQVSMAIPSPVSSGRNLWAIQAELVSFQMNNRSTCILSNIFDWLVNLTAKWSGRRFLFITSSQTLRLRSFRYCHASFLSSLFFLDFSTCFCMQQSHLLEDVACAIVAEQSLIQKTVFVVII